MKAEGGRRRAERVAGEPVQTIGHSAFSIQRSAFGIQRRPFRLPPSAFRRRDGVSLLEVLISIFVLSVGLLGLAAVIPVGSFAILETNKADRSGACGRAGLHEVKIRRMLEPALWAYSDGRSAAPDVFTAGACAIDPLGVAHGVTWPVGPLPRVTLLRSPAALIPMTVAEADRIFRWRDDLTFTLPEDMVPPPADVSDRPRAVVDASGVPEFAGGYSWLVTVTPAAGQATLPPAERTLYSVSVVVRYGRNPAVEAAAKVSEHTASVAFFGPGLGGGGVRLSSPNPADPALRLKENEWIMLCGGRQCKWYRVVSADGGTPTSYATLAGPDWDTIASPTPTAVVIDSVVGVYTTTVELDRSPLWTR